MTNLLRGNLVREVSDTLPKEIDLVVYAWRFGSPGRFTRVCREITCPAG